jgi:hypothetical protein
MNSIYSTPPVKKQKKMDRAPPAPRRLVTKVFCLTELRARDNISQVIVLQDLLGEALCSAVLQYLQQSTPAVHMKIVLKQLVGVANVYSFGSSTRVLLPSALCNCYAIKYRNFIPPPYAYGEHVLLY